MRCGTQRRLGTKLGLYGHHIRSPHMRHWPFLNILAHAKDMDSATWVENAPGYLVLRLFDFWVHPTYGTITADQGATLDRYIVRLPFSDLQTILRSATDLMVAERCDNLASVVESLLAYAKWLEAHDRCELAVDVRDTVAQALDPMSGPINPFLFTVGMSS